MLVLYRDGGLTSAQAREVESHLAHCEACRLNLDRLRSALEEVHRISAPVSPDSQLAGIWEGVRQRISAWERSRSHPEQKDAAVRKRVARQIEPFLGRRAAVRVIEPEMGSNRGLLGNVEVVLEEFLGRGAAASIVNDVVDATIVKR